ncbi:MAG: PAS domain-containing protein [Anaerolineae bacterium]|nr:PAS domain-containing protein [Anaerolineae bacterium]
MLQAQLSLRQALSLGLLEAIQDAVLVLDPTTNMITHANPASQSLLGETLVGETLIAATQSAELDTLLREAANQPGPEVAERLLELANRTLRAQVYHLQVADQRVKLVMLRDETELHRLGRARREMVANISHELRHPITTAGLLADTLLTGALKKPKRAEKLVRDIRREVDTLSQLVQEMRDLSLIESGQMPVRLTPTSLLEVINTSVEPLYSLAEHKGQSIAVNIAQDWRVLVDTNQIMRVIKNIVHNAIKFAPEDGRIHLSVEQVADEVRVAVENNGPPIPEKDLPRIFERFFQVDRSRSDGTGLGLSIAKHIVRSHGGEIWAVNNDPNTEAGVTFFFTLPLAEDEPALS